MSDDLGGVQKERNVVDEKEIKEWHYEKVVGMDDLVLVAEKKTRLAYLGVYVLFYYRN